jgi:hypothetical protein
MLDLEFFLVQKKIQQEREVKDLATKNEHEQVTSSQLKTYQNNLPKAFVPTTALTGEVNHEFPVTPRHNNPSCREPRLVVAGSTVTPVDSRNMRLKLRPLSETRTSRSQ